MDAGGRRLVVISRNPTMTWGLALPTCTIDTVRPQHLEEWAGNAREEAVDLIILDLGGSDAAIEGVRTLRANARLTPILLIGGDDPDWLRAELHELPGTHLMLLPIDRPRLLRTVSDLLGTELASDTPSVGASGTASSNGGAPARTLPKPPPTVSLSDRLAASGEAAPTGPPVPQRRADDASTSDPHAAVRFLGRRIDQVYGVGETAWAILGGVTERIEHDASCLMVHDELDDQWHVVAERGLASVERHMRLPADSWWIADVVHQRQAAIMTNDRGSSFTSTQAPLSRREQLLACAIPGIDALLLLARDGDHTFDDHDLDVVASITDEAGRLLADAVDVRTLARQLAPMIERPERLAT